MSATPAQNANCRAQGDILGPASSTRPTTGSTRSTPRSTGGASTARTALSFVPGTRTRHIEGRALRNVVRGQMVGETRPA
ncbi:hypothetical protein [Streptomyces luteogriseus]|uniref:hypothetical protein n=1 Tax=Streptomyces luteogriseus TaxID=68233 RepID=UPI0037FCD18D